MIEKTNIFSFQGVSGAYSELAGKKIHPDAKSIACKTFEDMFECVRDNKANTAIVPIENSRAGRVADTQRLIPNSKLKIIRKSGHWVHVDSPNIFQSIVLRFLKN